MRYEYQDAMFNNSLFHDYLIDNGLKVQSRDYTRDIICLEFNYGSVSYEEEIKRVTRLAKKAKDDYKFIKSKKNKIEISKARLRRRKISKVFMVVNENKDKYCKKSKEELRDIFYNEGVEIDYISKKKNGIIKSKETIKYLMLYRSIGKAKDGSCMFIKESLYKKAINFLHMGIKLKENPMLVEISAYAPLVSSTIVDKIQINPKEILILKDIDVPFVTDVISIETNEDKHCITKKIDNYELKNTIFDGQALIDSTIFPEWGNGYILLRHHFCKMAAFSSNIQDFFKDYFKEDYLTATVKDMFGEIHFVKDIKVITTDNSMKWIKFNKTYNYWCRKVSQNDNMFGIVKTAHKSKMENVQRMSYQMVNSLDTDIMENVTRESTNYITKLKMDDETFLDFLEKNNSFSNDYGVLIALYNHNADFIRSSYFRERRSSIIKRYITTLKSGKIIQNAENLVVVGSPYAMLLYSATGNPKDIYFDDTFAQEIKTTQCYTERFDMGSYLAFFRSPFNSKNNLSYLHNVNGEKIKKYFNLGEQTIAVNMIGTDFQDRNNGLDMDSDSGYCTNQPDIVEHAKRCCFEYPTIVNNIPKESTIYQNNKSSYALIDNSLAKANLSIGEASNLAQLAQTYTYNFPDQKYIDYVCILSVLAQVAIDNAKRRFDVDLAEEIRRIKNDMNISNNKYPMFWLLIKENFDKHKINKTLECPMNYLSKMKEIHFKSKELTLPMSYFFNKNKLDKDVRRGRKIELLISDYAKTLRTHNINKKIRDYSLLKLNFIKLLEDIRKIYKFEKEDSSKMISWLIDRILIITPALIQNRNTLADEIITYRPIFLKVLYELNSNAFLECFDKKEDKK